MAWYAFASLLPAALLALACLKGGALAWLALVWITVAVFAIDRLTRLPRPPREDASARRAGLALSGVLAAAHFALLGLGVWALSRGLEPGADLVALAFALGIFFGQISNPNAHELIHAPTRWPRRLGAAVFISLLFGHHVSAHLRVHHVKVATDGDPNSARLGEGFWRFWPRAWVGSFREGLRAETRLRLGRGGLHPYTVYLGGAVLTLGIAAAIGGWKGVLALLFLAIYAQIQLLISDYIQHYGLRRKFRPDGSPEPVGPQHSWNAGPWFSAAMMLNAPRHSDHHLNPSRPFPALRLDGGTMPILPSTFPMMGLVAALPPLWRRIMDPRVAALAVTAVNQSETTGGTTPPDLPDSGHVESGTDSGDRTDPADRRAGSGAIVDERGGV